MAIRQAETASRAPARLAAERESKRLAALERSDQRDRIDILQVAAGWQSPRQPCDTHRERRQFALDIHRGRIAFQAGVGSEDDFLNPASVDALNQFAHPKLVGTD